MIDDGGARRPAWLRPVLLAALGAALAGIAGRRLARRAQVFPVRARGESMIPAVRPGSFLLVTRVPEGRPRRGDVVVAARADGTEVVKRVAVLPGGGVPGHGTLGPDEYWLVGDNPEASTDSRELGPFRREALRGIVRACYWPPRRWRVFGIRART